MSAPALRAPASAGALPRAAASLPRADLAALAALALLALAAGGPLLSGGWFATHEGAAPLERVIALAHEIRSGTIYPRWLSLADAGKGSAFAHFYAPGVYLVSAWLYAAGLPLFLSLKLVLLATLLAGAVGTYCWTRGRLGTAGAFVAATLYLFAPYHFVDLYVRGALAEFLALGLLPWLFAGIDLAAARPGRGGPALVAVATAGIVLAHNLSAFMIAPFAAAYLLLAAWSSRAPWKAVGRGALGAAAGAGLSAFYWLPAIADQRYLRGLRAATTSGMYSFENHFVLPGQLLSTAWGHGASLPGDADSMSFQLGVVVLVAAAAGIAASVVRRENRGFVAVAASLGLLAILLTLEPAAPLYRALPVMPLVQFPWRYLGPAVLFLSAVGGAAASAASGIAAPGARRGARVALACGVAAACLLASSEQRGVIPAPDMSMLEAPATIAAISEHHLLGTLCGEDEYLPAWVTDRARLHRYFGPPRPYVSGDAKVGVVSTAGARMTFDATSSGPSVLGIPWYYFPGWTARIDGTAAAIGPGPDGFLQVALPAGAHRVELAFGTTPAGRVGSAVSALAAAASLVALTARRRGRRPGERGADARLG